MFSPANRFKKGSGVYACRCCEHRTRDTGGGGAMVGLCDLCYDLAGYENCFADGNGKELRRGELEGVVAMVAAVYNRGGKHYWDDLLTEVSEECQRRINAGEI